MENSRPNHKGFSLIEVMVAIVIVATIAMVSARSFVSMKKAEVGLREADICKSYLDSAFKNIDVYGVMPTLVDNTTIPHHGSVAPDGFAIKSVPATSAFPLHSQSLVTFVDSSQLTTLTTPSMLGGTITMLNGIYNDRSTNCDTTVTGVSTGTGPLTGLMPAPPPGVDSRGVTSTMTITPYDLSTGNNHANCGTTLKSSASILAPKGINVTSTAAATHSNPYYANADLAANVYNDVGFHVKLAVNFTTGDGRTHQCNAIHNYSYMADLNPPSPPDIHTITYDNIGSEQARYGPHTVTMQLGYSTTLSKPGVVLMCEDLSTANHDPIDNVGAPNGDSFITAFHPPLGHKFAPCEWVTVCGKSQRVGINSRASFTSPSHSYQQFTMTSVWPNNGVNGNANTIPPNGCIANVGVIAVDMAGNTSTEVFATSPLIGALQDCAGGWSPCLGPCGPGNGTQQWTDTWEAQYQGALCPYAANQIRSCQASVCPVINCAGTWSGCTALGAPAPTCGAGSGHNVFTVTTPASGGGTACPASPVSCSASTCPPAVDCVGGWNTCTGACGTTCTETYTITTNASGGGLACAAANGATRGFALPVCAATPTPTPTPTPPPSLCNCQCQVTDGSPLSPVYNVPSATTAAACNALNPPCAGILSECTWGSCPTGTSTSGAGGTLPAPNATCSCNNSNDTWNTSTSTCTAVVCPAGTSTTGAGGALPAPNDICNCANEGDAWNTSTSTCVAPTVTCPAGTSTTGAGGALPSPNDRCNCNTSGQAWNTATSTCTASTMVVLQGQANCACSTPNLIFHNGSNCGSVGNNGACVTLQSQWQAQCLADSGVCYCHHSQPGRKTDPNDTEGWCFGP